MSLAPLNPNSGVSPIYPAPTRPTGYPPSPPEAGPSDTFRASAAPPPPAQAPARQLPNGVAVRYAQDQHGVTCQASLPGGPGMLLPLPLVVSVLNQGGQVQTQAFRTDGEPQALPSQVGPDGSVYVQFDPNAPLAVLNNDFSFGLSSPVQGSAQGGYTREKMETIEPDNSRMLLFHEQTGPVGRDGLRERHFTEVRQNGSGLSAHDVTERSAYGQKLAPQADGWGDAFHNLTSGGRTETPRSVSAQPDGSLSVSAGKLKDHLLGALKGKSGWFTSPLLNANRQAGQTDTVKPFSVLMQKYRTAFHTATPAAAPPPPSAAAPVRVHTQLGDIAQVKADGLIANINSEGAWFGGVDGAIQRAGGNQFHQQAAERFPLHDGDTVVASERQPHQGAFKNVVFVVDDAQKPLREVVLAGLRAADAAGLESASLPAMRTGVFLGAKEATLDQTVQEMAAGLREFQESNPAHLKDVTFVVYKDEATKAALDKALAVPTPPTAAPPAAPTLPLPDRSAVLATGVRAMATLDERGMLALGEQLGIEPNAGVGAAFEPGNKGQLNEWRMGQAVDLASRSRGDLASEVLTGKYDQLQGQQALPTMLGEQSLTAAYTDHYANCGWRFPSSERMSLTPQEMAGRTVALLHRKDDGGLEELRGTLVPSQEWNSAIFTLKEHPGREFNHNQEGRHLALAPAGAPMPFPTLAPPPPPLPEVSQRPSTRLEKLNTLEDSAYHLQNAKEASGLVRTLGVQAEQRTGADFQSGLTGDDAQAQLKEWRLGQLVALTEGGRPDLAMETLRGQHDKLAGTSLLGPLVTEERVQNDFFARYDAAGWHTKADPRYDSPHVQNDLHRHEVAFLHEGREVRGRLTAEGPGSALFHVDGYPERFNLNELPAFAYKP